MKSLLVYILLALSLVACTTAVPPAASESATTGEATATTEEAAAPTERDSVVVAMSGGKSVMAGLDASAASSAALSFTVARHLYDSLIYWDMATQEWTPRLAESWERTADNTVRFHLRPDVTFHNGSTLTAEDVCFTLERILNPDLGSQARPFYISLEGCEAVDDLTVDLIGKPALILPVAHTLSPIDKETFEEIGAEEYDRQGIGTGAYQVVEFTPGESVVLEANPNYWGDAPKIPNITFMRVTELATKVAMLYSGEADIIDLVSPDMIAEIEGRTDLDIRSAPSSWVGFVLINNFKPPFDDVRVRQAIAHAINWQELCDTLFVGHCQPHGVLATPTLPFVNPEVAPYPYDPERAKELLAEAGYPDGFETTFFSPAGWFALDKESAEVIVGYLAEVGINAELTTAEQSLFMDNYLSGDLDLGYFTCGGADVADQTFCYRNHYHTGVRGLYANSPEVEDILDAYEFAGDVTEQQEMIYALQAWEQETVPYAFGDVAEQLYAVRADLEWEPSADERIYLQGAEWTAP